MEEGVASARKFVGHALSSRHLNRDKTRYKEAAPRAFAFLSICYLAFFSVIRESVASVSEQRYSTADLGDVLVNLVSTRRCLASAPSRIQGIQPIRGRRNIALPFYNRGSDE